MCIFLENARPGLFLLTRFLYYLRPKVEKIVYMKRIYLDNAATTPICSEVLEAMVPYFIEEFGNPSARYAEGRNARLAIENARKQIGVRLSTDPSQLIFTSGGTEANNLALRGFVMAKRVATVFSSPIEHASVSRTLKALSNQGFFTLQMVDITKEGVPDYDHLEKLLQGSKNEIVLVSLMHGNNEIGSMLDLNIVGKLCKQYQAYFHTDTVQSIACYPFDLSDTSIDMLTASAHKFHGPKGAGFLWVKKDLGLHVQQTGGSQEHGLRAGTECVASIVGMGKAFQLAMEHHESALKLIQQLKDQLRNGLEKIGVRVNGMKNGEGLPTILNIGFEENERSRRLLLELDLAGVSVGSGPACAGGTPSSVISAIQAEDRINIRFSFSRFNTANQIYRVLNLIDYQLNDSLF
jgi:cysteine desulfurase